MISPSIVTLPSRCARFRKSRLHVQNTKACAAESCGKANHLDFLHLYYTQIARYVLLYLYDFCKKVDYGFGKFWTQTKTS